MAELEIHHEHEGGEPFGRIVGIMAAVIAMLLAIVSIAGHRTHTEAVLLKTDANDKWSYYQAQRMKFHNLELGEDLMKSIPAPSADTLKRLDRYGNEKKKYEDRSREAQDQARDIEKDSAKVEAKALRFDIGEGLLEIGVVMTSMYFISKSKLFPIVGGIAALSGLMLGALGFMI